MSDSPPIARVTWRLLFGLAAFETALAALVFAGVCWVFGLLHFAPAAAAAPADEPVKRLLAAQAECWNRGDLDGFMAGYWKSDELTFFSGATVTQGWRATFDRYKKKYQADGKEMGTLAFTDLRVDAVSDECAFARGRWKLTLKDGTTPNGLFTLLLRKIDGDWRIVHDHTSAAEVK